MLHKHPEVGIVSMLRDARSGVRIPTGERDFSPLQIFRTGCGAQPAFYSMSTPFPSRRKGGRDVKTDHSPSPRAKVKNEWTYTSSPIRLHVSRYIQFYFIFLYFILFYILHPRQREIFITNRKWLVFAEMIGIGIHRENHRKYANTRSDGKQMVHVLTTLL